MSQKGAVGSRAFVLTCIEYVFPESGDVARRSIPGVFLDVTATENPLRLSSAATKCTPAIPLSVPFTDTAGPRCEERRLLHGGLGADRVSEAPV
jgi:hypothetical protein